MSGLVLKRVSGHIRRVLQRREKEVPETVVVHVVVYWGEDSGQIVEGSGLGWHALLTGGGVQGARTYIPVTMTGTVDPAEITVRDYVEFPPGVTDVLFGPITGANAAAGSSRTAIFTLDPSGTIIEPEPAGEELEFDYILDVDTTVGPDTFTLTILDDVAVAPATIDMGSAPAITGPESNITLNLAVVISGDSGTDIVAQVAVLSTTGVYGTNFIFDTQTVTFTAAEQAAGLLTQRVPFQIIDDGVELSDIVTTVRVTYVSGNASTGVNNDLAITVTESIQPGGATKVREIQWITQSQTVQQENGNGNATVLLVEARVVDSGDGTAFPFVQPAEIPVTVGGFAYTEWGINWQGNTPGFLSFGAGETQRRIAIQAPNDFDGDNETITFTVEAP